MNRSQKQSILDSIEIFESKDFKKIFSEKYKDDATPESMEFGDYNVSEIFSLAKKVIEQLKNRLEHPHWQLLPLSQNLNEFGSHNVKNLIDNITNYLVKCDYNNACVLIKALAYYQIINGFWFSQRANQSKIKADELNKLTDKSDLVLTHISERREKLNKLIEDVTTLKGELESFKNTKVQEYKQLSQNQESSNTLCHEIQNSVILANDLNKQIGEIKNSCESVLKQMSDSQKLLTSELNRIDEHNNKIEKTNTVLHEQVETQSNEVKNIYNDVVRKNDEIAKMMGYIADGTLSHSFNNRKQAINKNVYIWGGLSIASLIALVLWIWAVFSYFAANTNNEWANIIINAIKSSPIAFFLYYCLSHLSKERNLQEEYAFRESVAITLTSYLEQLEGDDYENKRQLLLETVNRLYTKPSFDNNIDSKFISIDTKDLAAMTKSLTDALAKLK